MNSAEPAPATTTRGATADTPGGGGMAALVRSKDWAATPLGPMGQWPQSLRTAVGICLQSRFPMFVWWGPRLINIYNDAYAPILGKRHPDALGRPARDIWGEIWPVVGPQAEAVMSRGEATWNERVRLVLERHGYTEDTFFTWSYSPIPDDAGGIGGLFCACTEETGYVRAEAERDRLLMELEAQRGRLSDIFRRSPSFMAVVRGPDHVFELANDRYYELVGHRDLIGRPARQALPEVEGQGFFELLDRVYATGEPFVGAESRLLVRRRPGEPLDERVVEFVYQPTRGPDGVVTGIFAHGVDLTDRKRAEEQLRRNHDTFYNLIQNDPFGVYVIDSQFRLREVSKGAQNVFRTVRPLLGRDFAEVLRTIWGEPFASEAIARFRHTLETGERYGSPNTTQLRADVAEVESYDWQIERVTLPDGQFGVVCYFYDLTKRRKAEEARRMSEFRFQRLVEQSPLSTQIFAPDGTVRQVNKAWERLWGVKLADLPGYNILKDEQLERLGIARLIRRAFEGEAASVDPIPYVPDRGEYAGQVRWCGAYVYPVKDDEGRVEEVVLVHNDVTERKFAEEALAHTTWRVTRLYAVSEALSEARTTEDVARVAVEQGISALGASAGTLSLLSEDGKWLELAGSVGYPPEVISKWQRYPLDAPVPLTDAVRLGEPIYIDSPEDRLRRYPALAAVRATAETKASACVPLLVGGKAVGVLGLSFDEPGAIAPEDREFIVSLTRQCAQALERARLFEAERRARLEAERASEAKSEFLASLSHELRTPLTPVLLTVSMMEGNPALPKEFHEDVASIRRNVELESRLISDLLDLTRIARGKLQLDEQDVDLHLVVRSAIDICQREASARLVVDLGAGRHTVRGDATRLQQVFWNLVTNAMKFTGPEGVITVRSADVEGDRVRVEVSDTGVGIDPVVLPKLFNAFEQGEARVGTNRSGLGLGLAISRQLAELHGGTVTAWSSGRGEGATFTVELPVVAAAAPEPVDVGPAPAPEAEQSLRVLLVEDHEPTLTVMTKLLRRLGHRVTGATSVASATAAASRNGFDVIISDLGLPDGSGLDVMRRLRDRYAGRAIALTGYGMESDIAASQEAGFAEHLTKPVDFATLAETLRRVAAG